MLIERNLVRPAPPSPPPLPVPGLIDDNAIDPGADGGLPSKTREGAEDAEKDFLRQVEGVVVIAKQMYRQLVHHPLMLLHELGAGNGFAGRAAAHERRLAIRNLRPTESV